MASQVSSQVISASATGGVVLPITLTALVTLAIYIYQSRRSTKGPLPPSPPGGLPILGNLLQLPKDHGWLQMHEWSKGTGPITYLNMAGVPLIVLNTVSAAVELLEKRSNHSSDRPRFIVTNEFMAKGLVVGFTQYDELWKKQRKAAHAGVNIRVSENYYPIMEREAALVIQEFNASPDEWDAHLRRVGASSIFTLLYGGEPILDNQDPIVVKINEVMHRLSEHAAPGKHFVEIFPFMKHLPEWMAGWKRMANSSFERDSRMFNEYIEKVEADMKTENPDPSFSRVLLEKEPQLGMTRNQLAWLAGSMLGAGADASAGTLRWFMLAATLYPGVMKKAQEEIDAVVGRERVPNFADRQSLPYVRALCKEVMRWRTVAPLGVPHRLSEDEWIEGYFLPKGSVVVANIHTLGRDTSVFDPEGKHDVEEFIPERFLNDEGTEEITIPDTHNQSHFTYGFGRRACAGMHIANNIIFVTIANVLWGYNIKKPLDASGKEITPSAVDFEDGGLVVRPRLWKVDLELRDPTVLSIAKDRYDQGI